VKLDVYEVQLTKLEDTEQETKQNNLGTISANNYNEHQRI
jgi:hypothetical protein